MSFELAMGLSSSEQGFHPSAPLTRARRVVVKVGSALVVDAQTGRINRAWLETLIQDLLRLLKRGQQDMVRPFVLG